MELYFEFKEIKTQLAHIIDMLQKSEAIKNDKKLYTLKELEDILKVKSRTISTYIKEGTLKGSKRGNKIWVTSAQLKNFLAENSSDPCKRLK